MQKRDGATPFLHFAFCILHLLFLFPANAAEIARADLSITGVSLEVDRSLVDTGAGIPAFVQTIFGGRTNDDAAPAPGLTAAADLTGPGIDTPIPLTTLPGRRFALPALHE